MRKISQSEVQESKLSNTFEASKLWKKKKAAVHQRDGRVTVLVKASVRSTNHKADVAYSSHIVFFFSFSKFCVNISRYE